MLSGGFPYGTKIAQAHSVSAQRKLSYQSLITEESELPLWIDDTLSHALKMDPLKRYPVISEFMQDLRQPNKAYLAKTKPPLIQRDPVMFWQSISLILFVLLIAQSI